MFWIKKYKSLNLSLVISITNEGSSVSWEVAASLFIVICVLHCHPIPHRMQSRCSPCQTKTRCRSFALCHYNFVVQWTWWHFVFLSVSIIISMRLQGIRDHIPYTKTNYSLCRVQRWFIDSSMISIRSKMTTTLVIKSKSSILTYQSKMTGREQDHEQHLAQHILSCLYVPECLDWECKKLFLLLLQCLFTSGHKSTYPDWKHGCRRYTHSCLTGCDWRVCFMLKLTHEILNISNVMSNIKLSILVL